MAQNTNSACAFSLPCGGGSGQAAFPHFHGLELPTTGLSSGKYRNKGGRPQSPVDYSDLPQELSTAHEAPWTGCWGSGGCAPGSLEHQRLVTAQHHRLVLV